MMPLATEKSEDRFSYTEKDALAVLYGKLNESIDDMENGRVQSIEEAWEEIDGI